MFMTQRMFISLIFLEIPLITTCRELEGYKFPVYTTELCPLNKSQWEIRSNNLNCTLKNGYICVPNDKLTASLEFCYTNPKILIQEGICLVLNERTSNVNDYNCSTFKDGCPNDIYWSYEIYKYPHCLRIGRGCFISESWCSKDRSTIHISTDSPGWTNENENNKSSMTSTTTTTFTSNPVCPDQKFAEVQIALLVIIITLQIFSICINVCREKNCLSGKTSKQQKKDLLLPKGRVCIQENFESFNMFPKENEKEYFPWELPTVKRGVEENEFIDEGLSIFLFTGNLVMFEADAFLISTNTNLEMKEGQTSEQILQKAGHELERECSRKKQEMENNKIVITKAYHMNAKWIIHISCPITIPIWIERIQAALERAEHLKCSSLALPLMGTGNANITYGVKTMCRVILKSISKFKHVHGNDTNLQNVKIVVLEDKFKELNRYLMEVSEPQSEEETTILQEFKMK